MSKPLRLLMKEHFKFPCFGSTLKGCIVLIVLRFATSLACFGGGSYYYTAPDDELANDRNDTKNRTSSNFNDLDEVLVIDLKGIKDPVDRNIITAWRGWKPSNETQKAWKDWHEKWLEENAKNGEVPWKQRKNKKGKGGPQEFYGPFVPGQPGGPDFSAERGPGSGWPNLPGWADLGAGSGGTPIPPWAYAPKNVGKPTICYLPPIKGHCTGKEQQKPAVDRWGYNPYIDQCQKYQWSNCGGTRNKFISKEACEKHCALPPPPSCSADSDIPDKSSKG